MATRYVDSLATGANDGSSWADAWESFADIDQASLSAGDVVVVMSGTYDERFTIAKSGTLGNYITYRSALTARPVLTGINGAGFDHIAVVNLEITQPDPADTFSAIALSNCVGWFIYGCYIHDTNSGGIISSTGANYNIIRRNTFERVTYASGGSGSSQDIAIYGDYNLVEYNSHTGGLDRVRVQGAWNIVRNEFWGATNARDYPSTSPFPHHTDGIQIQTSPAFQGLLIHAVWDEDNADSGGGTNSHHSIFQVNSGSTPHQHLIMRFGVTRNVAGNYAEMKVVHDVFIYNELMYGIYLNASGNFNRALFYNAGFTDSVGFLYRNNSLIDSPKCRESTGFYDIVSDVTTISHGSNHCWNAGGGAQCAYPASAGTPANLAKNDPQFTGPDDYTVSPASLFVGAGSYVALADGDGSASTSLTVNDAKGICDGWTIAAADTIRIGTGDWVLVDSIDYDTNIITLAEARTWADGDSVQVYGMQDVGPYPQGSVPTAAIVSATITSLSGELVVEVDDAANVDRIELTVDGYPVATSLTPTGDTYTLTWSGDDSASHDFVVVGYNRWASRTPTFTAEVTFDFSGSHNASLTGSARLVGPARIT